MAAGGPADEAFLTSRHTEVRDLLGHGTVRMTERYVHLAPENIRALARLDEAAAQPPDPPGGGESR
jgi:hypothetical protein